MNDIYRGVRTSFWTDSLVSDNFTPEDKYFYLWLITNPQTNLIGCYEVSMNTAKNQLGYTKDVIESLIKRFQDIHNRILFSESTKELLMLNWPKYNWTKSPTVDKHLVANIEKIKSDEFRNILTGYYNESKRTIEITPKGNKEPEKKESIPFALILRLLNDLRNGKRGYGLTRDTERLIRARWNEMSHRNHDEKIEDFRSGIYNSFIHWSKKEELLYMKPDTLFNTKFESRVTGEMYGFDKQGKPEWHDEFQEDKRLRDAGIKVVEEMPDFIKRIMEGNDD